MRPRRHILFPAFLSLFLLPGRAQVEQKGIVVEMSSHNRPVAGVQIKAYGATPTDSDGKGLFTLTFPNAFPGDPLSLNEVYLQGYRIVNAEKVSRWNISSTSLLKIVLGRKEVIEALRKKYYQIGESNNEKEYRNAVRQLEELKVRYSYSERLYRQKLDSINEERIRLRGLLDFYARKFACLDRDDLDSLESRAMALIDQGRLNEAIRVYEDMKIDAAIRSGTVMTEETEKDLRLLVPSLEKEFRLSRQVNDTARCDSLALLVYEAASDIPLRLEMLRWLFLRGKHDMAMARLAGLIQTSKSSQELLQLELTLDSLKKTGPPSEVLRQMDILQARIGKKRKWINIKERL